MFKLKSVLDNISRFLSVLSLNLFVFWCHLCNYHPKNENFGGITQLRSVFHFQQKTLELKYIPFIISCGLRPRWTESSFKYIPFMFCRNLILILSIRINRLKADRQCNFYF